MYKILLAASVFVLFSACRKLFKDEKLSMQRTNYMGSELKTNGFYHSTIGNDPVSSFILYRNGVFINGFCFETAEFERVEQEYRDGTFYNSIKDDKLHWGLYRVTLNEIEFEGWYPTGGGPFLTYIMYGEILNDTTIHIIKTIYDNEEPYELLLHFTQFSPKPDSTNNFVK